MIFIKVILLIAIVDLDCSDVHRIFSSEDKDTFSCGFIFNLSETNEKN